MKNKNLQLKNSEENLYVKDNCSNISATEDYFLKELNKDNKSVIKKFKEVEKKLLMMLKNSTIEFSDNDSDEDVKQNIKMHINSLNDVRTLFDEYEKLAKKIQNFDDEDDSQASLEVNEESMKSAQKITKASNFEKKLMKDKIKSKTTSKKDVDLSTDFSKQA